MATLHRPIARWPGVEQGLGDDPDRVGEVDDPGVRCAARRPTSSARSRTTGTVRRALAKPPGPGRLLADAAEPQRESSRRRRRAAWPPTRSWTTTKSAPSMAASRSVGRRRGGPAQPRWSSIRRASPPTTSSRSASMSSRTSSSTGRRVLARGEALDELRGVRAAAADDGDLHAHRLPPRWVRRRSTARPPSRVLSWIGVLTPRRPRPILLITIAATIARSTTMRDDSDRGR